MQGGVVAGIVKPCAGPTSYRCTWSCICPSARRRAVVVEEAARRPRSAPSGCDPDASEVRPVGCGAKPDRPEGMSRVWLSCERAGRSAVEQQGLTEYKRYLPRRAPATQARRRYEREGLSPSWCIRELKWQWLGEDEDDHSVVPDIIGAGDRANGAARSTARLDNFTRSAQTAPCVGSTVCGFRASPASADRSCPNAEPDRKAPLVGMARMRALRRGRYSPPNNGSHMCGGRTMGKHKRQRRKHETAYRHATDSTHLIPAVRLAERYGLVLGAVAAPNVEPHGFELEERVRGVRVRAEVCLARVD